MAKKGNRQQFGLQCTVCKAVTYVTERNKINTPEALALSKYCNKCRKHTAHKERKKLD
ncbi:50S ribosomal protein L33 [Candidatus Woesebacteria bacterium]|jgi:large subunit ribosomal protein L33|nr:50S ribosomal protein L33 [Candidatus Woesebacteria bacterium]